MTLKDVQNNFVNTISKEKTTINHDNDVINNSNIQLETKIKDDEISSSEMHFSNHSKEES